MITALWHLFTAVSQLVVDGFVVWGLVTGRIQWVRKEKK